MFIYTGEDWGNSFSHPELFWERMISYGTHAMAVDGMTIFSLLGNLLFIAVAATTRSRFIGAYKHLLIIFAISNIGISLMNSAMLPMLEITSFGAALFGHRLVDEPRIFGVAISTQLVTIHCLTWLLLAFKFFYRYMIICRPRRLMRWTRGWSPLTWSVVGFLTCLMYAQCCFFLALSAAANSDSDDIFGEIVDRRFGCRICDSGYTAIVMFRTEGINDSTTALLNGTSIGDKFSDSDLQWDALATVMGAVVLISGPSFVILFCGIHMVQVLRSANIHGPTQQIQLELFCALIIQMLIPLVFTWLPLIGIIAFSSVSGDNENGGIGIIFMISHAFSPILEPYAIVACIGVYRTPFRSRIAHLFGCKNANIVTRESVDPSHRRSGSISLAHLSIDTTVTQHL